LSTFAMTSASSKAFVVAVSGRFARASVRRLFCSYNVSI
jgi:hypothetical protein